MKKNILSFLYRNKYRLIFLGVLILAGLFILPAWLCGIIFSFFASFWGLTAIAKRIRHRFVRRSILSGIYLLYIFLTGIFLKVFMFDLFAIPGISMENTLLPGDVVLVDKISYGPRLPNSLSDISWFRFVLGPGHEKKDPEEQPSPYKYWKGLGPVRHGDIVVYELKKRDNIIKRCIGMYGDTLKITNGEIYLDNRKTISRSGIMNFYQLSITDKKNYIHLRDSFILDNRIFSYRDSSGILSGDFAIADIDKLRSKYPAVIRVGIPINSGSNELFANPKGSGWDPNNMGPLIVPCKGTVVKLNPYAFALYKDVINRWEGKKIEEVDGRYLIDGVVTTYFTFQNDYFFMMGDNRNISIDSRFLGFIPRQNIIGKAQVILYSKDNGGLKWGRLLKAIR